MRKPRGIDDLEQHRAVLHQRHRRMQRMGLPAQSAQLFARFVAIGRLGEADRSPSASVWSAPTTSRDGSLNDTALAFSHDSSSASSSGSRSSPSVRSIARSSIGACTISIGMPTALSMVRRAKLFEARTSGAGADQNCIIRIEVSRRCGRFFEDRANEAAEHRSQARPRFLDRAARDIDQRPVMPRAKLAGEIDLVRDRLPVDIGIGIVMMRLQAQKPVLPDLHDALRARE